jgi:hypothetical protein
VLEKSEGWQLRSGGRDESTHELCEVRTSVKGRELAAQAPVS